MKTKHRDTSLPAKSKTEYFSFGHKVVSVALAAVLMGFGWPAVNPADIYAEGDAPETAQSADDSSKADEAKKEEAKKAAEEKAAKEEAAKKAAEEKAAKEKAQAEQQAKQKAQEKAAAEAKSDSEAKAEEATEYTVSLKLGNASIKVAGSPQRLSAPASKVTVPAKKDFKFTVDPDNGYELSKVVATIAGSSKVLSADASGVYCVSASKLPNKVSLKLVTKKKDQKKTAADVTPVENAGNNTATDANQGANTDNADKADSSDNKADSSDSDKSDKDDESDSTDKAEGSDGSGSDASGDDQNAGASTDVNNASNNVGTTTQANDQQGGILDLIAGALLGDDASTAEESIAPAATGSVTISGADKVAQFSTITLKATVSPSNTKGTYKWSSSNDNILTVDNNGKVTGVLQGSATVTVKFTAKDGSVFTDSKDIEVSASVSTGSNALFYYLNNPDANLDGTANTGSWKKMGTGKVNLDGISSFPADDGKTKIYDRVGDRVVSWPDGSKGSTYSVKRGSSDWTNIFNQYKSEIEKQLPGVTVTQDDVESITIVPYKLTNNNDGKHVDCRVVVKCKNLFTAKYFVNDPSKGDQGFIEVAGKITYRSGDTTKPADFNLNYPATKTVGGVEYTFSGWYTDEALTHKASFPYTMNGNVNFYAKYVAGYQVNYDLAGGAWSNSDSLMYKAEAGTSQVVRSEPTREGYDFTGWTVEGLTGTTTIASGQTFVMPANNVTLTANWKKKEAPLTIHYYWNGTTDQVRADKTTKAELDQTVTETPASVEGYTPVSTDAQSVTIKAEGNEITFYYYKNVELVANSDTATYDGTEKQVSGFTGAPEGADFGAISVGAKGTNAGTYAAEFPDGTKGQVDGTEKYIVSKAANGKLVITPVADEVVVTIKGHQGGEAYNGNTQKVTGYDVVSSSNPLYKAEDLSLKGEAKATGTNAGTYDMGLKSSDFENKSANFTNVTFKVEDGKLVISKREVTLTSASDSKVYDGKPLTNDEVTVGGAGFAKGEGVTFDVTGSQTVVGSSKNAFTYEAKEGTDLKANYTITKNEGTLEVTPRSIEADGMQVDGPSDVPYDGKAHRWSPTVTDGGKALVEGADYEVSYDKGDFTNVTGPIKVTVTGKGNYEGSVERTYQVTQRQVTVHTGSASKVYDGKPLAKDEAFVENLVEGETVTIHATGSQTEVGSSANGYQLAWDGSARESNYHVASEDLGTLAVTETTAEVRVVTTGGTFGYDGQPHGATVEVQGLPEGYSVKTAASHATATDVDDGTVAATADELVIVNAQGEDVTGRLNVTKVDGTVRVEPRKLVVKADDAAKEYDGQPLVASGYQIVSGGFVAGQAFASVTVEGSQTEVGSSANVVTGHEFASNTKGSNYEVSYKPGKLVVTDDNVDPDKVITKTHASDAYKLGDEVTFVIEAKNIYASAKDMTFTELPGVKLAKSEFKDVAPGAIVSTTARYTITEDDILAGSFVNTVTVSFGDKAYAADDTVDVVEVNPELDVTKNTVSAPANGSAYQLGETITYKITVTNAGNVTLRGIALTDDNADDLANESIDALKPGDFKTFEASHKVTEADVIAGTVENNASATAKAPNQDEPVQSTLGHTEDAAGPSNPHLTIEKTTTTSPKNGVSYELDETIKYQVTVTNTGNLTLSNVALTDDNADDLDVKEVGTLAPGASKTFKASHKVTEADIQSGSVVNNATATATSPDPNKEVTVVPGQATDPTDAPNAHVTITKEAEQNGTAENGAFKLGETIHYTITVTNTGNQTAKNIKVSDDNANNFGTKTIESLAPGKSKTFKATHTVTESDILAGTVVNVATGESDTDVPVTPGTDEKKTEAVDATLAVSKVAKAPANGEAYQLGEEVTYKITITNKGNVSYSNVKVEDAQTGLSETLDALAVGESHEFTTTHVITEGDIAAGSYTNVVTAEADAIVDEAGTTYVPRATDDETIGANTDNPIVDPSAKLRLEKTVSNMGQGTGENGAFALGDVIKYQITVTNTGNLTVKDFVISDNNADGFTPVNVGALAPGASYTVAAQHVVTSDDILAGSVFNVATATGGNTTDPDTKPEPGKDQVDTPVASVDVPLVVTKTASEPADGVAFKVGEKVNYTISVTNAGNVPYENVKVTDAKTGLDKTIAELGVGQTREFTTSHVIAEADVVAGSYKNVATAKADSITDPKTGEEKVPAGEASETIGANTNKPIEASAPSIEVSKSGNAAKLHDDGLLVEGDVVTYKVTVTNTGNLTLTNVKLTDQLAGAQLANGETDTIASLAPGASATVKYRYTVTQADVVAGHVHNEATAKADTPDPAKPTVEPKAPGVTDDPTEATKPSLHIDKTDNGASKVPVGGTINYTLTVTNNGNVDLSDVVVTDQLTGLNHQIGNLAKGASVKVPTSYMVVEGDVVNGFVHNVATGSAKSPDNKDVKVIPGEATTTTEDMNAAIELEKTAAAGVYGAGDKITYTITVTNVGNVTITGVQTEDHMTGLSEQTTLAPGESATYTTDYVVTDADLKAGKIDNTATAKGLDPKGGEVAASDTETVTNDPQVNPENPDKPSLKRDFKVTGPVDVVYNGYSQYQKPIVKDGEKVLTEGVDYTLEPSADTTKVGKVTIRVMGKGNYTGEVECSYLITPASLVITTGSANKRYDGKALTNKSLTIAGLQGEDTVIAKTTGTQTKVGSSTNGYSIDWGTTNPDNYLITESLGTLTVRPAKAPAPDPTPGSTTPTPAPGPGNDNNPGGQGTNPGNEGNGTDNGSQPQPGNGDSGEKIYDSENPLGNDHPECWVHYYMIICMIITALYGVGVWARRGNYARKLKKDMDDVMGDGDGMDSPAATQPTTKPAGMEA